MFFAFKSSIQEIIMINTSTGLTSVTTHEKILQTRKLELFSVLKNQGCVNKLALSGMMDDSQLRVFLWWWTWQGSLLALTTRARNQSLWPLPLFPSSSSLGPGSTTSLPWEKQLCILSSPHLLCVCHRAEKLKLQCELTPVEMLCVMAGASLADAAANMERGSVPSSMEVRGSMGAEEEDDEDEEVLPLRAPRRVFASVTWVERIERDIRC